MNRYLLYLIMTLSIVSCIDGYRSDHTFLSEVINTQLESPKADAITIIAIPNSLGGQDLKISWSVVHGAGGYLFSLYNVDNPDNPIVIGKENEIIDGCNVQRERADDTKYKIVIKTLGNKTLNNTEAITATEISYTTLVPVHETIPSGTDLSIYFTENPIQPADKTTEIVYELESGGKYTMTSEIALKSTNVTLRGDKINRAEIKVSGDAFFISDGAGFRIRWADLDMTEFSGSAFIQYNETIDETNPNIIYDSSNAPWVVIEAESGLESCNITGLSSSIIKDNGMKYALKSFTFKDCIVEQSVTSAESFIYFTGALIKELTMVNSTFYNHNKEYNSNWIAYANVRVVQVADRKVWATEKGSIKILNSTFWQVAYAKQIFNSNGWAQSSNSVIVQNSIIVDTGNKQVLRRLRMSSTNVAGIFGTNTYWYDDVFAEEELTDGRGDKTGTELRTNPTFADPTNGDFTISGTSQLEKRTGDPRWLPAQ